MSKDRYEHHKIYIQKDNKMWLLIFVSVVADDF